MADRHRHPWRKQIDIAGDWDDPHGMPQAILGFLDSLEYNNRAIATINQRQSHLAQLASWLDERGVTRPSEVTKPMLQSFVRWLFTYRKANGEPRAVGTQSHFLQSVRLFFRWLERQDRITSDPARIIDLPKEPKVLPQNVLSHREVELVLAQPKLWTPTGLRDRAILETFYATGIRRAELADLLRSHIDFDRATVFVRQGKGAKDRVVPIGERGLRWINRYLSDARPWLAGSPDNNYLYLSNTGNPIGHGSLSQMVRKYIDATDLGKGKSCHTLRHAMATALLDGGANLRVIQEILGHANLTSTEIYTHVSIQNIQDAYNKAHPAATAEPRAHLHVA